MNPLQRIRLWVGHHLIMGLGLLILIYTFVPIGFIAKQESVFVGSAILR